MPWDLKVSQENGERINYDAIDLVVLSIAPDLGKTAVPHLIAINPTEKVVQRALIADGLTDKNILEELTDLTISGIGTVIRSFPQNVPNKPSLVLVSRPNQQESWELIISTDKA